MRNEKLMRCLAMDIGGSSIKRALFDMVDSKVTVASPLEPIAIQSREFSALRTLVVDAVGEALRSNDGLLTVAVSTTGAVDRSGLVLSAGHFHGYENISWSDILRGRYPMLRKVLTVNDGKAATWAEYRGLGQASEVFAHFVVGTGVGGGLVCFDRLLYGDDETAGALGHMKVALNSDAICSCGRTGCVETVASGPAIVRGFASQMGVPRSFDLDTIAEAASAGSAEALRAFEVAGSWLGVAISNVINVLNPRFITIGGGVVLASMTVGGDEGGPYLRAAVRRARELAFEDVAQETRIVPSRYGNDSGMFGAALLAAA
ncbi:MAG: ROK family protein [Bryobacteraceae bacterium]